MNSYKGFGIIDKRYVANHGYTERTGETMAGRPTKYNDEILEKAKEYVSGGFLNQDEEVPTQEGLALFIGVHRSTLHDWASQPEKHLFSDILEECNQRQTVMLMSGALKGDLNANIAKLMLGKQGYSEKHQQELTGAEGGAIKTESTWIVQPVKGKDAES